MQVSDELFEQDNGELKRWSRQAASPQNVFGLAPMATDPMPYLLGFDSLRLCTCIGSGEDLWDRAAQRLVDRLGKLGLAEHVSRRHKAGQTFYAVPRDRECLHFVCVWRFILGGD